MCTWSHVCAREGLRRATGNQVAGKEFGGCQAECQEVHTDGVSHGGATPALPGIAGPAGSAVVSTEMKAEGRMRRNRDMVTGAVATALLSGV